MNESWVVAAMEDSNRRSSLAHAHPIGRSAVTCKDNPTPADRTLHAGPDSCCKSAGQRLDQPTLISRLGNHLTVNSVASISWPAHLAILDRQVISGTRPHVALRLGAARVRPVESAPLRRRRLWRHVAVKGTFARARRVAADAFGVAGSPPVSASVSNGDGRAVAEIDLLSSRGRDRGLMTPVKRLWTANKLGGSGVGASGRVRVKILGWALCADGVLRSMGW